MNNKSVFEKYIFLKTIIWASVIMILCVIKPPQNDIEIPDIPHLDKVVHFGMYYILALFLMSAMKKTKLGNLQYKTILFCVFYGTAIEVIQDKLGYRSGDFYDFAFNTAGAIVGTFTLIYIEKVALFKKIIE